MSSILPLIYGFFLCLCGCRCQHCRCSYPFMENHNSQMKITLLTSQSGAGKIRRCDVFNSRVDFIRLGCMNCINSWLYYDWDPIAMRDADLVWQIVLYSYNLRLLLHLAVTYICPYVDNQDRSDFNARCEWGISDICVWTIFFDFSLDFRNEYINSKMKRHFFHILQQWFFHPFKRHCSPTKTSKFVHNYLIKEAFIGIFIYHIYMLTALLRVAKREGVFLLSSSFVHSVHICNAAPQRAALQKPHCTNLI